VTVGGSNKTCPNFRTTLEAKGKTDKIQSGTLNKKRTASGRLLILPRHDHIIHKTPRKGEKGGQLFKIFKYGHMSH